MDDFSEILVLDKKDNNLEKKGLRTANVWRKENRFHRNNAILYNMFGIRHKLYGFTEQDVQQCNKILLYETGMAHWIVDDLRKWSPFVKIKFIMKNIVSQYGEWKIDELKKRQVEIFSFDPNDCRKYGFKRYPALCFYEKKQVHHLPTNDVYFIGKDKGRACCIIQIQKILERFGFKTNFNIVLDKTSKYRCGDYCGVHFLNKSISYDYILEDIFKSKVILDIVQPGQSGLTMRPMEALFYDKKLITNNVEIKAFPFYSCGNIFVLDNNNMNEVIEFLRKPFYEYDDYYKEQYTYEKFLELVFGDK